MHQAVWPEVLATIAACHIENYSIFLLDGLLFAYLEYVGTDFEADMQRMAACPDTRRWWKLTDAMQEPFAGTAPGRPWRVMDEVFHFGGVQSSRDGWRNDGKPLIGIQTEEETA